MEPIPEITAPDSLPSDASPKLRSYYERVCFVLDQVDTRNSGKVPELVEGGEPQIIDLTIAGKDYWNCAFALAWFGEPGRALWRRAAQHNVEKAEDLENDFTTALDKGSAKNPDRFFTIAKAYDLETRLPKTAKKKSPLAEGEGQGVRQKKIQTNYNFWYTVYNPQTEKEELAIRYRPLMQFQNKEGNFWKLQQNGDPKNYDFIRVDGNIVDYANDEEMQNFTLHWLDTSALAIAAGDVENEPDPAKANLYGQVYEKILKGAKTYFAPTILRSPNIPHIPPIDFVKDDDKNGYLYFENCWLHVTGTGIKKHDYKDLPGKIWRSQVIHRNFELCTDPGEYLTSQYAEFINLVAAKKHFTELEPTDASIIKPFWVAAGYLIHGFKNPALSKAVIGVDGALNPDKKANGGTGKDLFGEACGHIVPAAAIDGQLLKIDNENWMNTIKQGTRILRFNDMPEKFPFTRLFNVITGGFKFKQLYKDAVYVDYANSPKVYYNTNFIPGNDDRSTQRRQYVLEFQDYFEDGRHSILDEFNKMLFIGWQERDWLLFDNFMAWCLQSFLADGLVKHDVGNFEENMFTRDVPEDVRDWFDTNLGHRLDEKLEKKPQWEFFIKDFPRFERAAVIGTFKINTFTKWLHMWCKFNGLECNAHKAAHGYRDKSGGIEYITITKIGEK